MWPSLPPPEHLDFYDRRIVRRDGARGCWIWEGARNANGYGIFNPGRGKSGEAVHRKLYKQMISDIPKGYELHHTCKNPNCVNPLHLIPMTRAQHREAHKKQFCKNGHDLTNAPLRWEGSGRRCVICQRAAQKRYNAKMSKKRK